MKDRIAKWVREARTHAELSGAQLGERIALELQTERGSSKANISHWELGRHEPSLSQVLAIAKITGFPLPADLMLGDISGDEVVLLKSYRASLPIGRRLIDSAVKASLDMLAESKAPTK